MVLSPLGRHEKREHIIMFSIVYLEGLFLWKKGK